MGVQIGSVKEKTPYPKSVFGETLTEHSGITELMDDLGEGANDWSRSLAYDGRRQSVAHPRNAESVARPHGGVGQRNTG